MDDHDHDLLYWRNWIPALAFALVIGAGYAYYSYENRRLNEHFAVTVAPANAGAAARLSACTARIVIPSGRGSRNHISGTATVINADTTRTLHGVVLHFRAFDEHGAQLHEDYRAWHDLGLGPGASATLDFEGGNGHADALTFPSLKRSHALTCELFSAATSSST